MIRTNQQRRWFANASSLGPGRKRLRRFTTANAVGEIMLRFLKKLFQNRAAGGSEQTLAERNGAEERRRQGETHLEQFLAEVRDYAIFLLDRHGNVTSWNAAAARLKGYQAEEVIGRHFSIFYPEDRVAAGWPANELEVAATTGRFEDENWRLRKDGTRFWANVVITALRDEGGEISGFLKITRDLTQRQRAEENARRLLQEEAARRAAEASALEAQRAQREERRHREQLRVTLASIGD